MRRGMLFVAAVVGVSAAFMFPGSAVAKAPVEDSVTGIAVPDFPCSGFCLRNRFTFDVHAGPSGEAPTGTVLAVVSGDGGPNGAQIHQEPVCMTVKGNRATIGVRVLNPPTAVLGVLFFVEDNGGTEADRVGAVGSETVPTACPLEPTVALTPLAEGNITVVDAPPKPRLFTHRECKLGGWARIGFKSRKQCDNFVRWQCNNGRHTYYGFPTRAVCRFVINRT